METTIEIIKWLLICATFLGAIYLVKWMYWTVDDITETKDWFDYTPGAGFEFNAPFNAISSLAVIFILFFIVVGSQLPPSVQEKIASYFHSMTNHSPDPTSNVTPSEPTQFPAKH